MTEKISNLHISDLNRIDPGNIATMITVDASNMSRSIIENFHVYVPISF